MSINTILNKVDFRCDIAIPYGQLQQMIEWCQNNTQFNWRYKVLNEAGSAPGFYEFIFDDETDYVNFMLWKK